MALFLLASFLNAGSAGSQTIENFILRLQEDLRARDFEAYLEAFLPELQPVERDVLSLYFDQLKVEDVTLTWANKGLYGTEAPRIFIQAIFQNPRIAFIETWQIVLQDRGGRWLITEKKVRGNLATLYKIKIPAERAERVELIEIRHADIRLTFRNALVFYDNIPEMETALLVIGDGTLSFHPSDPREEHQLELIYKRKALEDSLEYAYLRFSDSFFNRKITITRGEKKSAGIVSEVERNKAYSLFMRYHRRYFTIESPFSQEPLTFLPQGDEVAMEFRGKKIGELSYVYSDFAMEEITLYDRTRDRFINLYSPEPEGGKRRMVVTFGQKYDITDYNIELDFDPRQSYISAKARISVLAQVSELDALKFRFNPALEILRIYDDERRELFFTQDKIGRLIYVYFLEPIQKNAASTIEILYRGQLEPPPQLTDTVSTGQYTDTVVFIEPRYETYLFSQAAQWYPSPPDDDYFTARIKIIVPPQYSSMANGRLLEKGTLNGMQKVTEIDKMGSAFAVFVTRSPVKYLSFLVGKFSLAQKETNPVPLASYFASDIRWQRKNYLAEAAEILKFYENAFGPFPFEGLSIIQRLWPTAGGHSPASFIILNELPRTLTDSSGLAPLVPNSKSPVDISQWKEYFLAHEIAHQWWGQGVSPARYRDQWISEGLAQFSSALYIQSQYGSDAFSGILKKFSKWTKKKAKWGAITLGSRLSFIDFQAYQAIIYDKSSLVLNMLRDFLGDQVFFSGLRQFFERYKYGAASTWEFKQVMESVSGRRLDDFFTAWFDSHRLPEVRVTYRHEKREGGDILRVRVEQSGDAFVFPLGIEWRGREGDTHREKVIVENRSQDFELPIAGEPKKVRVNPDEAVPGRFKLDKR
jgi:hypothetical protein